MNLDEISTAYELLLRQRFPSVRVRPDPELASAEQEVLAVFCIPDERLTEYAAFMLDELPALVKRHGLPRLPLIPHSLTVTKEHYRGLWAGFSRSTKRKTRAAGANGGQAACKRRVPHGSARSA